MIDSILYGITRALDELGYEICVDDIKQDFEPPCFLITPLSLNNSRVLNNQYDVRVQFSIQFFPENENYRAKCIEVTEQLNRLLSRLNTADGEILASGEIKSEMVDKVLITIVQYHTLATMEEIEDSEIMNMLQIFEEVKGADDERYSEEESTNIY